MPISCQKTNDNEALIIISGEFDKINVEIFKNEVLGFLSDDILIIRINLAKLDFIDATGIGIFVSTFLTLSQIGGEIILENAQPHINDLIEATQITRYISLINTEAQL